MTTDVIVVGAGAAGCATALALQRRGVNCVIVEKSAKGAQRFCGEFVSGEAREFLDQLGVLREFEQKQPTTVKSMGLYASGSGRFEMELARGGYGMSRQTFDGTLLDAALQRGARALHGGSVAAIERVDGGFEIELQPASERIRARAVIAAHGRRSAVDRMLERPFIEHDSRYVGVKCWWNGARIASDVKLFLFPGGHCGLVRIENGRATMAMLATRDALRAAGGRSEDLIEHARRHNAQLRAALQDAEIVTGSLKSIGQIPFRLKDQVARGVFFVGDAAGTTAPFLGLGVTNALRTGIACSAFVADALAGNLSQPEAALRYEAWWRRNMRSTQLMSYALSAVLCRSRLGEAALHLARLFPTVARGIYERTRASAIRSGNGEDPFLSKA